MKNPAEVLRIKELEIVRVKKEIEALRIVAGLLANEQSEPLPRKSAKVVQLP